MSTLNDIDFGSESEEGDFNPKIDGGSGDEGDEDQAQSPPRKKSSKRPSPAAEPNEYDEDDEGNDDRANDDEDLDDEDDENDEDDEDDEDAVTGRPRKRAKRDQRNQFIDIEAEVDEEDEEGDEDDEGETAGFIAEDHADDLGELPAGAETDDRRHRELDRRREQEQQMDAEKQAALLKERYGRSRTTATDAALVPKRLLLPSVDDPSIWGVRCKPGKEREVVMAIMKRVEERRYTKNPMPIISALERGGTMMGYVYLETRRQADIIPALDGIMNVYPRTKIVLVPIKEMPDLLRVRKTESLQPGGYVRMKRGKYQGDLAQIDDVESNGLDVTLKIVPRLDYGLNDDANAPLENGQGEKRKRALGFNIKSRPAPRLFNEAEARKKQGRNLQVVSNLSSRKHFQFFGDTYINGYLIKDFRINHLQTEDVNPTLEEVTKFTAGGEDGNENLDLTALAASLKANTAGDSYLPGDMVEVFEGEQQGVFGRAVAVRGDIVTISVNDGELKGQRIEVPVKGLRKRFHEGDHVKVIGGSRFRDEVGLVVRIKDDQVTIVSDLSMQEITVFSKDLRVASDSGVAGGLGRYDIHDLVQLDPSTVGCVIKVDRESLRVLDQNGSVKTIMPSQITNKIEKRRHAVATDRNGSEIRHDDTVREIGGESKQGVIIHIHRSFLFLLNREQTENSGLFVVRASNVATVAAKGGRLTQQAGTGPDLNKMNPALQRNGNANGSMMPPPRTFGRDRLLNETVKIRKGPYKGLMGIVKDTTDTEARVELHTKNKTIQIAKDILGIQDKVSGNLVPYDDFAARGRGGGMRGGFGGGFGGATPSHPSFEYSGSRTPIAAAANGGRTPAWGSSRTPAWSSGGGGGGGFGGSSMPSRTPAYSRDSGMNGGRTPGWAAGGDGGRTSYGGAGSRTPAWESGSRTAYGSNSYGDSSFGGGKTPAYDSSRTPAYTPSGFTNNNPDPWSKPRDAPTPGAPTPSNPYSAPTPAASAPTPGFSGGYGGLDAPTPGAGAPTPYSGDPETPAWGGADSDDDGPRYDESPSP